MVWAKKERGSWHSLEAHSADVAAVFKQLVTTTLLYDRLSTLAGRRLTPVDIGRLCYLAFLHDLGKANKTFQDGQSGHLTPVIGLLFDPEGAHVLSGLPLTEMRSWVADERDLRRYLITTWSHHGDPIPDATPQLSVWDDPAMQRVADLAEAGAAQFPDAFQDADPLPASPQFEALYIGVLTLADWIASDTRWFPMENGRGDPWPRAQRNAKQALSDLGFGISPTSGLQAIVAPHDPYAFQEVGTDMDGQLMIAEAPTGSGKTELALGRYARLHGEGTVNGTYFAVPTRAAAKQLHDRVCKAADKIFPDPPAVVQAVPGYIKADEKTGIRRGWDVYWDGKKDGRYWAAEGSKRYLANPVSVGTVDQVHLAGLQTPHAHMRMAGLSTKLLIVDEIHSSDTYMTEILQSILRFHLRAGGYALLMSATMGARSKDPFLSAITDRDATSLEDARNQPYPLIQTEQESTERGEDTDELKDDLDEKNVEIQLVRAQDMDAAFTDAVRRRSGGKILGIRNTVDGARNVHNALHGENRFAVSGHAIPHHSRYAQPDRKLLDEKIEELYGEKAAAMDRVTIATQTVEQSLDIDADLLVTDFCPMDVLLQRIGRLHRHTRIRPPGYETARCIVIVPDTSFSKLLHVDRPPAGLGTVYDDMRVLQATLEELEERMEREEPKHRTEISIPRDNRTLVENSTHPDVLSRIVSRGDTWTDHAREIRRKQASAQASSDLALIDWDTPYAETVFVEADVQTRLGELDYEVQIDATTPLGHDISSLSLPAWMVNEKIPPTETIEADEVTQTDDGFTFILFDQSYTYTSHGLSRDSS